MKAILLAAGEGNRLRPHTADRPKCLVPLWGRPLLDYALHCLRSCGVEEIAIVTGHQADRLERYGLETFHNEHFATTNMVASLFKAACLFDGSQDLLIAYTDILYTPHVLRALLESKAP